MESLICPICGKGPFKDHRGLNGHKAIVHGVDTRVLKDSDSLKTLKEIAAKMDQLLARQREVGADLGQIAQQFGESFHAMQEGDLRPMAGDLAAVKKAVTNELPHALAALDRATGRIRDALGEPEPPTPAKKDEQKTDWGSLIIGALGMWALWKLLQRKTNREAPPPF